MLNRWKVMGAIASLVIVGGSCTPDVPLPTNNPPVAAASATPTTGAAPLSVAFSSAGSFDPDGSIAAYLWTFGDGNTSADPNPTHEFATVGTFTTTLKVTDDKGAVATKALTIVTTGPANVAPTAVATATPASGNAPLSVALSSAGSGDTDGTIVAYDWDFGDGSPHSTDANPTHVYTSVGSFAALLTVTDDDGATAADAAVVVVTPNLAPTAAAAATPESGVVPLDVTFSSAGSNDTDGTVVSFDWDFGDGSVHSSDANPTHTYTVTGPFTATLTVTDNGGATDTATVDVTVNANVAPNAVASGTNTSGKVPLTVGFVGSASNDSDGSIASYSWDFGDGSAADTTANPSHQYTVVGNYIATLTVTDDKGGTDSATVNVTVNANTPATAVLNNDVEAGKTPLTVNFDSSASVDADGSIASRTLDFGDGSPEVTTDTATHTYVSAGTFTATLTVTDSDGATSQATKVITVTDNVAPTAAASATPSSGTAPLAVSFSSVGSSDTDGTITTYSWSFGDGGTSADANPSHTYAIAGVFTATVTVTDDNGATDSADVVVTSVGAVLSPTSGPEGTVISVTLPCSPPSGGPAVATAIVALVSVPGGTVVATASFDNSATGNPSAVVALTVPVGTPAGSYAVNSSCDNYLSSTQYAPAPFTVT